MKIFKILILLIFIGFSFEGISQPISGIKTIPGNYSSIQTAIVALNTNGVGSGGVIFNIAAGYTETFTNASAGIITTLTSSATNPVVFQKSGIGSNPVITAAVGVSTTNDGIIKIIGADYITFDGINLKENPLNLTSTTRMEWGYAVLKQNGANGSNYVTIKNCAISLNKDNLASCGIYQANVNAAGSALTVTSIEGTSSNNKYFNDSITNVYYPIYVSGSSIDAFYDGNIEIGISGGNFISDFGGNTPSCYGIFATYTQNLKIANNSIIGGSGSVGALFGIYLSTAFNSNVDVYSNTITLTSASTNGILYAIYNVMGSNGVNNHVNIFNNSILNCSIANSISSNVYFINNEASAFELKIYGNTISNFTSPTYGAVYGVLQNGAVSGFVKIYDNLISNISRTSPISGNPIYGIYSLPTTNITTEIYTNSISQLNSEGSTGIVAGIATGVGLIHTISKNKISRLTNNSVYGLVYGIHTVAASTTLRLTNNYISELYAPSAFGTNSVIGMNFTFGTNIYAYFNTIYLNAVSNTTLYFGTSGINLAVASVNLRLGNNVVVNNSIPFGTGYTVAFRKTAGTYSSTSNYNCFYAGIPATNKLIYYDNSSAADQTMAAYRSRFFPAESNSVSEFPPFLNSTLSPYNLHLNNLTATQCEGNGSFFQVPFSITDDFDGNLRNLTTPDIGADEGNFIKAPDQIGPNISFTDLPNTLSTTAPIFSAVIITDKSDINTIASKPRLYYKKSTDANVVGVANTSAGNGWKWVEATGVSSPFSFAINYSLLRSSVVPGDIIQYFIVAQDTVSPANISSNPSLGFVGSSVSTITSAPTTPKSYRILVTINGILEIPGNYPNLTGSTGLFADINNKVVNGNIIVKIKGNLIEPASVALNEWIETGIGNYSLTIIPDTSIDRIITGFKSAGGLIVLYGADRVVFDGRYAGGGNYLTFNNTSNLANSSVFLVASTGPAKGANNNTIRNCKIIGGSNSVSSIYGIYAATSTITSTGIIPGGADIQNLSIVENLISTCFYGIFAKGVEITGVMSNLTISGNTIGTSIASTFVTYHGVDVANANLSTIKENHIFNINTNTINNVSAIEIGTNFTNSSISRNNIHGLRNNYYFNDMGDEYVGGAYGINIAGIGCNNIQIDNNVIYDISSYGGNLNTLYKNPIGILISNGSNHKIYFNSVNLFGSFLGTSLTSTGFSSPFAIGSLSVSGCDVRNNIFVNKMTATATNSKVYASYALTSSNFALSNFNDYYVSGSNGVLGFLAGNRLTLADWKLALPIDSNSVNVDPSFTTDSNLLPLASSAIVAAGTYLNTINYDYLGFVRSIIPCVGAYEIAGSTYNADAGISSVVFPTQSICEGSQNVTVSLKNYSPNTLNTVVIAWKINGVSMPNFNWTGSLLSNETVNVTLGFYNFVPLANYSIYAATSAPNSYIDINPSNDAFTKFGVSVKAKPSISYMSDTIAMCFGAVGSLVGTLSGTPPWTINYTDSITNFSANNILSQNFSIQITTDSSKYYYFKTILDGNGCSDSITNKTFVKVLPLPDAKTIDDTIICKGNSVSIGFPSKVGSTYIWSPAIGLNAPTSSNPIASPNITTTYTLTEIYGPGCSAQNSTVVNIKALPNIVIIPNGPTSFCQGDSVLLNTNADPGLSYQWYDYSNQLVGSTNSSFTAYSVGNYSVKGIDSLNCSSNSAAVFVSILSAPIANLSPFGVVVSCEGDSVLINATAGLGFTYQWLKNGLLLSGYNSKSIYVKSSGLYQVIVTNSNYCSSKSEPVNVIFNPTPIAIISTNSMTTICAGDSTTLVSFDSYGPIYKWYKNGIVIPNELLNYYQAKSTGAYRMKITNNYNCSSTSNTINVTVNPSPIVNLGNDTMICDDASLLLNAGTGAVSYLWSNGSVSQTLLVDKSSFGSGLSVIWAKATNLIGCSKTDTIGVVIFNCTGIDEVLSSNILVFPNPSSGIFILDIMDGIQIPISVYSLTGELLFEQQINSKSIIDLSNQPKGVYLLRINLENGKVLYKKLIVN